MLGRLRDLFNFLNNRRDNTCQSSEFKQVFLDKLALKQVVTESQIDLLILRYRTMQEASRVSFLVFLRDMEYCDQGVSPSLIWAIDLCEDITKSLILKNVTSTEHFFQKFSKLQGILLLDEFRRAMDELQITIYHDEEVQEEFFRHVEMESNKGAAG